MRINELVIDDASNTARGAPKAGWKPIESICMETGGKKLAT